MQTRFRTLLLAGVASLAMSGALAQGTINGSPTVLQGLMKVTCGDGNNSASLPCFVSLAGSNTVTANQGAPASQSQANAWPVLSYQGTTPWSINGPVTATLNQGGTALSAGNPIFVQVTNPQAGSVTAAGTNGTTAQAVQGIPNGVPQNSYPGQYNTTLPTLASGATGYLAVDVNGRLVPSPTVATAANQASEITLLTAANLRTQIYVEQPTGTAAPASQSVVGAIHDMGASLTSPYTRVNMRVVVSAGGGTLVFQESNDNFATNANSVSVTIANLVAAISAPVASRYWRVVLIKDATAGTVQLLNSSVTAN